jgi:hypothetical protein
LACRTDLAQLDDDLAAEAISKAYHSVGSAAFRDLDRAPVDSQRLFEIAVALEAKDPAAAAAVLNAAAEKNTSAPTKADIALALLRVGGGQRGDARAKQLLLEAARADPRAQQLAIQQLTDTNLVSDLCGVRPPISVVWRCAEVNPAGLGRYLEVIAHLPILDHKDAWRLSKVDSAHMLEGLTCLGNGGWRASIKSLLKGSEASSASDARAIIYARLSKGAQGVERLCLLEAAARECVGLTNRGQACSSPSILADYVREMSPDDQAAVIGAMLIQKGETYRLFDGGSKQAGAVLLHLHIALSALVLDRSAPDLLWLAPYHVARAASFWTSYREPGVALRQLFSSKVTQAICSRGTSYCSTACASSAWQSCTGSCIEHLHAAFSALGC